MDSGFVFVSYSRSDLEYVELLTSWFDENEVPYWYDKGLEYGVEWPREIQSRVETCSVFLLLMSPASFDSRWVQNELLHASENEKVIIPLLLQGESWLSVKSLQYVDVQDGRLPDGQLALRLKSNNAASDDFGVPASKLTNQRIENIEAIAIHDSVGNNKGTLQFLFIYLFDLILALVGFASFLLLDFLNIDPVIIDQLLPLQIVCIGILVYRVWRRT